MLVIAHNAQNFMYMLPYLWAWQKFVQQETI